MRLHLENPPIRCLSGMYRQGVEVNVSGKIDHLSVGGIYTLLDATREKSLTVDGDSDSVNDRGSGGVGRALARGAAFLAPGAPIGAWGGIRFTF